MTAPLLKTKAEQRLDHLKTIKRALTEDEHDELRRAMHAVYVREHRLGTLQQHRNDEIKLLSKLHAEAKLPSRLA